LSQAVRLLTRRKYPFAFLRMDNASLMFDGQRIA
jgi:hypothetical protein